MSGSSAFAPGTSPRRTGSAGLSSSGNHTPTRRSIFAAHSADLAPRQDGHSLADGHAPPVGRPGTSSRATHSQHRFPAPSALKEGCRKPMLGVRLRPCIGPKLMLCCSWTLSLFVSRCLGLSVCLPPSLFVSVCLSVCLSLFLSFATPTSRFKREVVLQWNKTSSC